VPRAVKSLGKFPDPFWAEIAGQPDALRRVAAGLGEQVAILERIGVARGGPVTFTGMGASYAACYSPVTILARAGIGAALVDASELLHFRRATLGPNSVLVLVSQSGRSAELIGLAEALGPDRPFLVSVTNGTSNPLARVADAPLDVKAGKEEGPSTMTFAATLVACAGVASVLAGRTPTDAVRSLRSEAARAAVAANRLIEQGEALASRLEAWLDGRSRMVILGRGTGLAAAGAAALILKEAARIHAERLGTGQFRHGPLELAGPDLAVAIVATEPDTEEIDLRLASDLVETGSAVAVVGAASGAVPPGAQHVDLGPLAPGLAPAISVIPFQLLAWRLSTRSGMVPGRLTIASKVTTRE